jgi:hypothetical protein
LADGLDCIVCIVRVWFGRGRRIDAMEAQVVKSSRLHASPENQGGGGEIKPR